MIHPPRPLPLVTLTTHDAILARQIAVAEELRRRRLAIPMALDPVAARAAVQGLEDEAAALELARPAMRRRP